MLLPFLLNYLICWYVWATVDKRKAVTWVVALLNFYPQYVASKIIWEIWNDPKRGLQKKRLYQRNVLPIQTFCEAVPSTLIMTFLIVRTLESNEGSEVVFNWLDPTSHDCILFFVATTSSFRSVGRAFGAFGFFECVCDFCRKISSHRRNEVVIGA